MIPKDIVKSISRLVIPVRVKDLIKKVFLCKYYQFVQHSYKRKAQKLGKKDKIKVAFFLIHDSVWKYDGIYRLMEQDSRFNPIVVICPYIVYGEETMLEDMQTAFKKFSADGYNVIKTYDEVSKEWVDVKMQLKPDIVFFTNPHELTKDEYYITNYTDCLTCYAPYGITHTHLHKMQYNQLFHNVLWKYFVETDMHKDMARKYADCGGINAVVTGYPGIDAFFDKKHRPNDVWKIKDKKMKRIIWAPHHTLDEDKSFLSYSNFLSLSQTMLDIAHDFKDEIQIAFKPHPLLRPKLYLESDWGKEKTHKYYARWKNLVNGQLNESDYVDLFLTSDAMILDSGSFLNEYLCLNKPSLYIIRDDNLTDRFNDFGKMAFACHYHGKNVKDILNFVKRNVIDGNDEIRCVREKFIKTYLIPPNNISASTNIFNYIVNELSSSKNRDDKS